jgi:hypothetical protein
MPFVVSESLYIPYTPLVKGWELIENDPRIASNLHKAGYVKCEVSSQSHYPEKDSTRFGLVIF